MSVEIQWHSLFFLLMALVACGSALAVVFSASVVRMAFWLVVSLGAVAGLFFLAGADFLGALQLMVYVGGTLVLLVFGVMLTARPPFVDMRTAPTQWLVAALVGASLLVVLWQAAWSVDRWAGRSPLSADRPADADRTAAPLGLALVGVRVDKVNQADRTDPANLRLRAGMAGYLLPFEIVSVHLVVVLVGAAYLARAKRRPTPPEPPPAPTAFR
jgi:NADH:ubiquinone oxidoreductase subunit 6 (subunit J)